jgi:Asp/Glu/hydantoin racemase
MLVPDKTPPDFHQCAFGEAIGIIVYRKWYPALIYGHHNYATTYDFPIRLKFIDNWVAPKDKEEEWAGWNLPEYIRCARELEKEGVAAITTNCGMTGSIQEELANAVNIPVFTSNLMQVPFVSRMIGKKKKVGILTVSESRARSHNCRILRSCGIDESIPIAIRGMEESEYADVWRTQTHPDTGYDPKKVETIMVAVAKKLISENRDVGAIVLECTEMPLYAAAIREATGLLVFDSSSLVKFVYNAIVKKHYF